MKRPSQNPEYSREREFKVILENLEGEFKAFGEGQEDIRRGLNRIEDRVQRLEGKVDHLEVEMSSIRKVLPTLTTKDDLKHLEKRLIVLATSR